MEVYTIPQPSKSIDVPEAVRIYSVDIPGHRTDVRTLSLSSDDQILASASNGGLGYLSVNFVTFDGICRLPQNLEHKNYSLYQDYRMWICNM